MNYGAVAWIFALIGFFFGGLLFGLLAAIFGALAIGQGRGLQGVTAIGMGLFELHVAVHGLPAWLVARL